LYYYNIIDLNHNVKSEIKKSKNILIQSNKEEFNYLFLKDDDIEKFNELPEIISRDKYDYCVNKNNGDDTKLPELIPLSLISCKDNLDELEQFYREKFPRLPDEYHGILARYSSNQNFTKKEAKNALKKYNKNPKKDLPVGLQIAKGKFEVDFK